VGPAAAHVVLPGGDHVRCRLRRGEDGRGDPEGARDGGRHGPGRPTVLRLHPHLLGWVHVAEIESFLAAHQRYGARPLDQAGRDEYVDQTARVAEALGVVDPPRSESDLLDVLADYRPELEGTPAARRTARFLLLNPPLPVLARAPYGGLAASAVSLMPLWSRRQLRLPHLPVTERVLVRATGTALTGAIRWAMGAAR
jgi:uncharacterized protein (DUF2236 family)